MANLEDATAICRRIIELTRELQFSVPAPRGVPFYGIDSNLPFAFETLDGLGSRGIFRKYELVAMREGGFGGVARWLAMRMGCRVVAIDPDPTVALVAHELNRRSHTTAVQFVTADPSVSPFDQRIFTHYWMIGAGAPQPAELCEAHRILRPGGHFALQSLPGEPIDAASRLRGWLEQANFVDIEIVPLAAIPTDRTVRMAQRQFGSAIEASQQPAPCWQLFAHRRS